MKNYFLFLLTAALTLSACYKTKIADQTVIIPSRNHFIMRTTSDSMHMRMTAFYKPSLRAYQVPVSYKGYQLYTQYYTVWPLSVKEEVIQFVKQQKNKPQ